MRTYLTLTVCALVVGAAIATSSVPAQNKPTPGEQQKVDKAEFESQFPLTDINNAAPSDPAKRAKWNAKSKKYKGMGSSITERSDFITVNSEWDIGLPALPVSKSDLIVVGEVVDARAYLSEGKDWVYSEFTIRVEDVLKNTSDITLTQGGSLDADREGGRVRFPSGHITTQYVVGQGMPRVGRRYTLFLACDEQEQSTHILTGYELRGGRVFPVDHPVGAVYKEADEASFLNDVRTAIVNTQ